MQATQVRKAYGNVEVLHGVDLAIGEGERVALMGPSGSGKSTLLNCLCGIEPTDAGTIEVDGKPLDQADRDALDEIRRTSVGYVFQGFHLLPTLSAAENIELTGQLAGMPAADRHQRVAELLSAIGLEERANHRPDALSGGERQRVAVARAVMHRPRVILADEPTGSLDTKNGERVLDLLEQLSDNYKIAIVLVTHDSGTTRICERTLTMQDGRIEG